MAGGRQRGAGHRCRGWTLAPCPGLPFPTRWPAFDCHGVMAALFRKKKKKESWQSCSDRCRAAVGLGPAALPSSRPPASKSRWALAGRLGRWLLLLRWVTSTHYGIGEGFGRHAGAAGRPVGSLTSLVVAVVAAFHGPVGGKGCDGGWPWHIHYRRQWWCPVLDLEALTWSRRIFPPGGLGGLGASSWLCALALTTAMPVGVTFLLRPSLRFSSPCQGSG